MSISINEKKNENVINDSCVCEMSEYYLFFKGLNMLSKYVHKINKILIMPLNVL